MAAGGGIGCAADEAQQLLRFNQFFFGEIGFRGEQLDYYRSLGYNMNERVGQFGIELSMEEALHGRVVGQDAAIVALSDAIRRARRWAWTLLPAGAAIALGAAAWLRRDLPGRARPRGGQRDRGRDRRSSADRRPRGAAAASEPAPLEWVAFPGGLVDVGH